MLRLFIGTLLVAGLAGCASNASDATPSATNANRATPQLAQLADCRLESSKGDAGCTVSAP
jgi:hypothetical protein